MMDSSINLYGKIVYRIQCWMSGYQVQRVYPHSYSHAISNRQRIDRTVIYICAAELYTYIGVANVKTYGKVLSYRNFDVLFRILYNDDFVYFFFLMFFLNAVNKQLNIFYSPDNKYSISGISISNFVQ